MEKYIIKVWKDEEDWKIENRDDANDVPFIDIEGLQEAIKKAKLIRELYDLAVVEVQTQSEEKSIFRCTAEEQLHFENEEEEL